MKSRKRSLMSMEMFEHHKQPLLPWPEFLGRMGRSGQLGGTIVLVALLIGIAGYHYLGQLHWMDALVNASMILGGMGPVDPIPAAGGKIFESVYALFSGVAFLTSVSIFLAPALHRLLHRLHLESESESAE
jgi:hypothetical protein